MDREDLSELRHGLFGLYVFCIAGAMISLIADVPLLMKIFFFASSGLFFWWVGTFLWQLMPHKLYEYYTSDEISVFQKIFATVFWLSMILCIVCGGAAWVPEGYVADNLVDKIMFEWPRPYIHYIFALAATSGLGGILFRMITRRRTTVYFFYTDRDGR